MLVADVNKGRPAEPRLGANEIFTSSDGVVTTSNKMSGQGLRGEDRDLMAPTHLISSLKRWDKQHYNKFRPHHVHGA
jgi:hypothetical protein